MAGENGARDCVGLSSKGKESVRQKVFPWAVGKGF